MYKIIWFILLICIASIGQAAIVTYSWTGSILSIVADNGAGNYTGTQVGDNFSGSFTYDPNFNNINGLDTSDGDSIVESSDTWVEYFLGSSSGTVTNGTTQTIRSGVALSITNDFQIDEQGDADRTSDLLGKSVSIGELADGWGLDFGDGLVEVEIAYGSLDSSMYSDLSFRSMPPWSPPELPGDPANQVAYFQISEFEAFTGNLTFSAHGLITTSVVPEPPAILLFGIGLIGLVGFSKRRKAA